MLSGLHITDIQKVLKGNLKRIKADLLNTGKGPERLNFRTRTCCINIRSRQSGRKEGSRIIEQTNEYESSFILKHALVIKLDYFCL